MNFQIGEKVGFLYEKGEGTIIRKDNLNRFIVVDETGFERPFNSNEIIKIHSNDYQLDKRSFSVSDEKQITELNYTITKENIQGSQSSTFVWEIDLHIEEILESHIGLSNTEILIKQMTEFKSFFKKAIEKNISKLIVIHGVGEGVLKNEIRSFLSKKEGVEFFDASYLEYGKGATEIRLYHSKI